MPELEYMPLHVMPWLLDTADLTPEAYTAYHRLLCSMWLNRSNSLPMDHKVLANRAGFSPQKWPHVWPQIAHFFVSENSLVHSLPLDKVRGKARSIHAARSEAGRKGAEAKWLKDKGASDGRANGKANGEKMAYKKKTILKDSARGARGCDLNFENDPDAKSIREGKRFLCASITPTKARRMIQAGVVTREQCEAVGVL